MEEDIDNYQNIKNVEQLHNIIMGLIEDKEQLDNNLEMAANFGRQILEENKNLKEQINGMEVKVL